MINPFNTFLLLFLLFGLPSAHAQGVKINEIMASNGSSVRDEDGDNPDWVELYNSGQTEISLLGYGLSDNYEEPFKWVLPNVSIKPGGFLLIYASDKDRKGSFSFLHTNFKISAEGEEVLLTNPDGIRVDEISPREIPTDFSFGRQADGEENFMFFAEPTPKSSNINSGFSSFAPAPVFSHSGGFYDAAFELTISSPDPEATIIYTVDGSVPDPANLSGTTYTYKNQYPREPGSSFGQLLYASYESLEYSGPVPINDRSSEPDVISRISSTYDISPGYFPAYPVFKGTVVKARVIKPDAVPGEVIANTYFVTAQGKDRYSLPVVSVSVSPDALFDYEKGIYVAGQDFDSWRRNNSWGYPDGGTQANYKRSGSEWEVPSHLEVFDAEKGRVIAQGVGIRIHGGWTRVFRAKSLRIYARNEYGATHINYPIFSNEPYDAYKRLVLRNSGNDFGQSMFRDAAIHAIVKHFDMETMAFQPAILFINSEYWGIHNFRERYDKHYFERKYGADPDKIDILEINMGVDEGDASHYRETVQYIELNNLWDEQHYDYIKGRIDVENFIDYQIAQIFSGNSDWPGNNIKYWRTKTASSDPDAPEELDGRWRWLFYDTDNGFGLSNTGFGLTDPNRYTENTLKLATEPRGPGYPNPPWSTFMLRKLLENETFRNQFINRFSDQLNTALKPAVMKAKIQDIKVKIEPEIEEHMVRWKAPTSMASWQGSVNEMLDFADFRPGYQWGHIKRHFQLQGEYQLSVDVSHPNHGHIRVNSLELKEGTEGLGENIYPWSGKYFQGLPIEVEAIPAEGYFFVGWEGSASTSSNITIEPTANLSLVAIFSSVVSGIGDDAESEVKIKVYPNPVEDEANLKINIQEVNHVKVSLHDLAGKAHGIIFEGVLLPGTHTIPIITHHLSPGVYVVSCRFKDQQMHQKLVKY